jgi:hypothetical protein
VIRHHDVLREYSCDENYEQNAPSRAIRLPCYQDSPLVTIADESSALGESPLLRGTNFFGAKSVAVLVESKLEATAWNDFPNMGSFSPASRQALALAEYVDILYIFAACTTAPRFPLVYGPATANVSRADGLLKGIRIGMGASLADGGPARQEVRASRLRRSVATMYTFPGTGADPAKSLRP